MKSKSYIGNRYNRVKLYKKGKFWVASSITFLSLGIGAGVSTVHAANISSSSRNEEVEEVSSSSASKINAWSFSSIHMQQQSVASSVIEASASQKSNSISSSRESQSQTDSSVSSSVQSSSSVSSASSTSKQSSAVKSSSSKQASSSSEDASSVHSSSVKSSLSSTDSSKKNAEQSSTASSMSKINGVTADKALASDLTNKEDSVLGANAGTKFVQNIPVIANRKNDEEDQANDNAISLKDAAKVEDAVQPQSLGSIFDDGLDDDIDDSTYGDWKIYFVTTDGTTIHGSAGYIGMEGYQVEEQLEPIVDSIENQGYQYVIDLSSSLTDPDGESTVYCTLVFKQVSRTQGQPVTVKYVTKDGKTLGTGTAEYTSPDGDTDTTPYVGDTYSTSAETSKGYHLVKNPTNATGTVTSSAQTVTYTYAPDTQKVTINYIDPSEGTIVDSDTVTVSYGTNTDYNAQQYVNENMPGYEISGSDLPSNGVLSYGSATSYSVYLDHKIDTTTQTSTYTQTIKYQYANGSQAEPTKTTTVTFTRTVKTDEVTGEQTVGNWTTSDSTSLPAVTSPTITGYTPDQSTVAAQSNITPSSTNSTVTVTYNPNQEKFTVKFVDQTENNKVLDTVTETGSYDTKSSYSPESEIESYEKQGYLLVSNGYPTDGYTFNQDGADPTFTIVLKHNITQDTTTNNPDNVAELSSTVNQTINYVYGSNTGKSGQTAAPTKTTAVTFTRSASYDHVTKQVTYGAWTPASGSFPAVTSPTIAGYTPSAPSSTAVTVTPGASNNTQTITYNANDESAKIEYIDQTDNNSIIKTDTVNGVFGQTVSYDPTSEIKALEAKGYQLVSNGIKNNQITFTNGSNQVYQIVLKHGTTTETPSSNPDNLDLTKTVSRTINYQYQNGSQAANPVTNFVTFTRTATKDNVTGKVTYTAWTSTGNAEYPAVTSPTITGYTASQTQVATSPVAATDSNSTVTVTYTPNQEKATVTFIDDTTGKTLSTETLTGAYNTDSNYNPQATIDSYEKQGYQLVSDDYPTNGAVFGKDGVVQNYQVHLKEATETFTPSNSDGLDLKHTVTQTIHYVYSNGKQAAPDATASITFNRTATKDEVTGAITYTPWTVASSSDDFPAVKSPTITGYTPGATASTAVNNVTESTPDNVQTITYTPNKETAMVKYVDQTTEKMLQTVTVNGVYDGTTAYDPISVIQGYEKQGYVLVNNGVPANGITFSQDGVTPTYTVTLKHGTTTYTSTNNPAGLDLSNTVTHTVHYVYSTGGQAQPDNTQKITFTRTATKDNVTGKIVGYTNWTTTGSNSFPSVVSPTITGYTPNPTATTAVDNLTGTSANNVQTVTYSPNREKATVTFVDETTGKTLQIVTLTGAYGTTDSYNPQSVIQQYEAQGYEVSSDNYPANGVDFDEDGKVQNFTIGLTHKTTQSTQAKTVTQTITYVYNDGKQAAPTKKSSITFTRTATKDQVTGAITYTPWTSGKTSFPAVDSPAITGYTPDKKVVSAVTGVNVNAPADNVTVTYTPNQETASVQYIDDITSQVIKTFSLSGAYNSKSDYDPDSQIQSYEKQGYKLVSNDYPANGAIFGEDGKQQVYQIHLTETTTQYTPSNNPEKLDLTDTVTHTVKYQYQDGTTAADSKTASVTFTRNATKNNVTGVITYTPWTPAISNFPQEVSPTITGYTPSVAQTAAIAVKPGDQNSTQTVVYTPNQEKITVTYIDQTTGKTLQIVPLTGAYNTKANYDPQQQIQDYENQGYQLVDNSYPQGGVTFSQDGTVMNYNIYLKHKDDNNPTGLDLNHTVTETIKYVYSNGKEAAPSKMVTLTFHRDATKDDVTGKVTYGAWTPVDGTNFPAVDSPVITGYTPSQSVGNAINNVSEATPDYTTTVTYTPNQEKAMVTYIDDTTGKTITVANLTGAYDTASSYSSAATIKQLEGQGYEVVSDDYPQGGVVFNQDGKVQTFTIHLKHKTTTETATNNPDHLDLSHTITQTIKYQYDNGTTASQPHTAQITYTRTATKDDVTGKVTYSDWTTANNDFPAVDSPTITGYTPSQSVVGPVQVTPTSADQTTVVTYIADQETATVTYVDDTTGKVLNKQTLTGAYGSKANYDIQGQIKNFENHGYQLVSDDYPANGEVFNNPEHVNKYVVHLKHKVTSDSTTSNPDNVADLTKTVSETVTYTYANGKTAAQSVTNKVTFTRTATKDQVTGKVTYGAWPPADNDDFPAVDSPAITGYTPSVAQVGAVNNVAANASNIVKNVVYTPNEETATVTFVDATTGKTISVTDLTGPYGSTSDYSPAATIKQLENQGYEVVSDNYPQGGVVFNQDGTVKNYTITLKHKVETLTPDNDPMGLILSHKITRTINYVDANGKQMVPSVTQTITFTRNATVNEVTGQVTYTDWQPSGNDDYNAVESPAVKGYTPTQKTVEAENNVSVNSTDQVVNVVYTADKPATPEHKPSEPAKKPQTSVAKPTEHVQPSKKTVQTVKPAAGQSLKVETVKKAVSTKQASSANEGTVRVAEQSTKIEKQTPNNSAVQPNESKNTLPQTGEDSANHSLFGELLIALSGLLGFFGIGKRKKDKEE